jgi:alkylation response protein AidB-like acyl-CoA dehydrogenase
MPIVEYGDEEMRGEILPRLSSGEWAGANAITEEGQAPTPPDWRAGRKGSVRAMCSVVPAAESAMDTVRIFGDDGIRDDRGVGRELRDAVPVRCVFSGTSGMQLELIVRELRL